MRVKVEVEVRRWKMKDWEECEECVRYMTMEKL